VPPLVLGAPVLTRRFRPAFAFLCNEDVIRKLSIKARRDNAQDGSNNTGTGYGSFLQAINRLSYTPEGEPLRRLVEPYMVRVGTVNPYTVATLMSVNGEMAVGVA
jgi:hypothetical protein